MSKIKFMAFDPGTRNLGFSCMEYDEETRTGKPVQCGVIKTPQKFKGNDALLFMQQELKELFESNDFGDLEKVVVEVPKALYGGNFQAWGLIPVAVVAGMITTFFHAEKLCLVSPSEWNRAKKKEKTHANVLETYGEPENWDFLIPVKTKTHYEHIFDAVGMIDFYLNHIYLPMQEM